VETSYTTERDVTCMVAANPRSLKREQAQLSAELRAGGASWADVAVEMTRRYRVNSRVALRLAHGLSQREAAERWNERWPDEPKTLKNFSAWEQWPGGTGHAPSLRTLDHLARLYQCHAGDLLRDQPDYRLGTRPAAKVLVELPADIQDFTGRDAQASEIVHAVTARSSNAVPIVVVSGKGGLGKTALALHVAHRVHKQFPDGQIYTDLRGVEEASPDTADVLAGFLRELGVDAADIPEQLDERARMYRARLAGRRVLVVLDNAADEAQVRPLLPGNPDCSVIITSRSRLAALAGARSMPLDVMPDDQATQLLVRIIGGERAAQEPAAVTEIARACGFLPLAIRIAGARLASRAGWRVSWFAERLRDERSRLSLLKVGDLDVRASFALSYTGRSPDEQHAFRMLGILKAGDFTSWKLATLTEAEPEDAEQLLESLVDAELVEVAETDRTGIVRYRLHDLLRDFARELLAEHEPSGARRAALIRLVDEYVQLARLAADLVQPGALQVSKTLGRRESSPAARAVHSDPRAWFTTEKASLIAAVQGAYETDLWDQTWQLVESLAVMFDLRADWRDWNATHALALQATQNAGNEHAEAVIRRHLGRLYRELGRYDDAATMLQRAADIFLRLGDKHRWATVLRNLGDTYRYQGRLDVAIESFGTAVSVFDAVGDHRSRAGALNGMADAYRGLSRWADAEARFEQCIATYREIDDRLEQARSTVRYAMVFRDRQLNSRAEFLMSQSLTVFDDLADRRWQARTLRQLGVVYRNSGRIRKALASFTDCIPMFEELADRRGVAVSLRNRGDTHLIDGDHAAAESDLHDALFRFEDLVDRRWATRTRLSLSALYRDQHEWQRSADHLSAALETFDAINDEPAKARALRALGLLLRDQERLDEALDAFDRSKAIFTALGDDLWTARVLASIATVYERRGDDAGTARAAAEDLCRRSGITDAAAIATALKEW
jgi:tetratricopeptide (TPR) repeat protein/transcriptional regulator with XRE-family HTH domain